MIALTATTDVLELVLSGAITTNQLDWLVTYVEITTPTTVPTAFVTARADGTSNSTSTVTLVSSPAATKQRQVKFLSVTNIDTAPATVQIKFNDNGTRRLVYGASLGVGYTLTYTDGDGWRVWTTTGALLTAPTTNVWVQGAAITLTNAQFKALAHPTPITVIPAPGAGFWISDFSIAFQGRFTAGAYTNVDAAGFLWCEYSGGDIASNYIANDATIPIPVAALTTLTGAVNRGGIFQPWVNSTESNQWGNLVNLLAPPDNQAIQIRVDNNGAGDFTGGNAANTFVLRPFYLVSAIP